MFVSLKALLAGKRRCLRSVVCWRSTGICARLRQAAAVVAALFCGDGCRLPMGFAGVPVAYLTATFLTMSPTFTMYVPLPTWNVALPSTLAEAMRAPVRL